MSKFVRFAEVECPERGCFWKGRLQEYYASHAFDCIPKLQNRVSLLTAQLRASTQRMMEINELYMSSQRSAPASANVDSGNVGGMYEDCVYKGVIPNNGKCNALCRGGLPLCSLPNDHARNGSLLHSWEIASSPSRKRRARGADLGVSYEDPKSPRVDATPFAIKNERCTALLSPPVAPPAARPECASGKADVDCPKAATDDCDDLEAWLFGLSEADIEKMVQELEN